MLKSVESADVEGTREVNEESAHAHANNKNDFGLMFLVVHCDLCSVNFL